VPLVALSVGSETPVGSPLSAFEAQDGVVEEEELNYYELLGIEPTADS